jgi:hypothetical protein
MDILLEGPGSPRNEGYVQSNPRARRVAGVNSFGLRRRIERRPALTATFSPPPEAPMPSPARLSHQLRKGDSPHLDRRRWLVGLSFVGSVAGMIVGLYQMGVLRRLPDLPVGPFDATKVDASTYACKRRMAC